MTTTTVAPDTTTAPEQPAWRPFRVWVKGLQRLSPTFLRVTFTGGDLDHLGHDAPDQRIKVYIPPAGQQIPDIGLDNWYAQYRQMDPATRGALRTYTIVAVRPEAREVDIDFVLHGDSGPASTWANRITIGAEVALIGPNRQFPDDCQGYEWKPPAAAHTVLIAGDETALPAISGILASMRTWSALPAQIHVLVEVPNAQDVLPLTTPDGVDVTWLIRDHGDGSATTNGEQLVDAVRNLNLSTQPVPLDRSQVDTVDIDLELLWEVAANSAGSDDFYAWVAGEAGAVKAIRRYLVRERCFDRNCVTFMGYWRLGRSED